MRMAAHRHAMGWLALVAFVESSVFPIPPDVMILPMALADRARAFRVALVASVASVAGGCLGYAIGWFAFDAIGRPLLEALGAMGHFATIEDIYNRHGALYVFGAALTPFPYKVITIFSGATGLNPLEFLLASIAGRAGRFYLECWLLWRYGAPIRDFIEKRLKWLTLAAFALLLGGALLWRWLAG